jgi:hypothetical protein
MRSLLRSVALLATLTALPAVAAAQVQDRGVYAGLAVGPGARMTGDFADGFNTDGHASGRIFGGYRFGPWGVEAAYFGAGFERNADGGDYTLTSYGLAGKYHLRLGAIAGGDVELYVRLGLHKASVNAPTDRNGTPGAFHDYGGMGIDYGTGVSWQSQPLGTARIKPRVGGFLDLAGQRVGTSRDGASRELNGSLKTIQLGVISSISF